jgi:soluble lytic murein transglycosylase-like protein
MIKLKLITGLSLVILAFAVLTTSKMAKINDDPYLEGVDSITIVNSAPSIQMYFYIKKYAAEYEIPEAYAFSLAYQETRYQGPLDLDYNHKQTSYAGALGPMQIMPSTAKMIYGKSVSNYNLKNDIKLNVMISMKLLRRLRNTYGNWGVVFGAYNTGRPCINGYAKNILDKQYIWEM